LGLAAMGGDFSYGLLEATKVRQIDQMARWHGFSVADLP
jgi:hypothetical protein